MANAAPLFGPEAVGRYDELRDGSGTIRPHWQRLADALLLMPPEEYRHRNDSATRMVRENGVTYNVYDDASGLERLWQLDIAPFVISPDDWSVIETAVKQRAGLANAILRDVYGAQRLLRDGVIPPQLVFGHPQYLRAMHGATPADHVHVHLYSADIARARDGSWIVHASRADVPTGLGYALENRIVVSQTFPELFGELGVQRLATFFRHHRDAVVALARGESGHAVLLTPGTYNEAYFEHSYHARYLGLAELRRSATTSHVLRRRRPAITVRSAVSSASRSSSGASTPISPTRSSCGPIRRSGSPDSSKRSGSGPSWSQTRSAAASSSRPRSTPTCPMQLARCSEKSC